MAIEYVFPNWVFLPYCGRNSLPLITSLDPPPETYTNNNAPLREPK